MTNAELLAKIKDFANEQKDLLGGFELQSDFRRGETAAYSAILSFLSTLESEKPINPDDAMKELDEKIALVKQSGTWDGVDVDEYMDEVRGRAPEKPINQEDELNGEIKKFVAEYGYERSEDILLIAIVARHFAEWGYLRAAEKYDEIEYNRQRAEEDTPNDLEEAADNFANQDCARFTPRKNGFIAGAKWQKQHDAELIEIAYNDGITIGMKKQKEQMMKEAVEGKIIFLLNGDVAINIGDMDEYKLGDKIRIIIVKDD